jgi:predicted transposase/invertase (TIGR01784 family)
MKFDNTNPNEYVYMGYTNEEEIATSKLEMHFIELPKFIAKNPGVEGKLEQWLWLICGREDKLQMAEQENEEVKKAADLVEEMLSDPQVRELYDARLMAKWNYATSMAGAKEAGHKEGLEEGLTKLKNEKINIAKKLKNLNMPDKEICEITGLTQEELNNI